MIRLPQFHALDIFTDICWGYLFDSQDSPKSRTLTELGSLKPPINTVKSIWKYSQIEEHQFRNCRLEYPFHPDMNGGIGAGRFTAYM